MIERASVSKDIKHSVDLHFSRIKSWHSEFLNAMVLFLRNVSQSIFSGQDGGMGKGMENSKYIIDCAFDTK